MNWVKQNRNEAIIILLILLLTLFLRLYRVDQYMTFLGDEGRDVLIVKEIVLGEHFPLLGPPMSVGNMYLGPLYYYMMAVAMAVSGLSPIGPVVMVGLIGTLSVLLVYYLSREWFGKQAAVVASLLYSVSPVNIIYSRSSWNPNPLPFFSLLAILGLFKAHQSQNFKWFILTGGSLAFAMQMHYLAIILVFICFLLWLNELRRHLFSEKYKNFWLGTFGSIGLFSFLMSPLVIFDLNHRFVNYRAITSFLTSKDSTVSFNIFDTLQKFEPLFVNNLVGRYMAGQNILFAILIALMILIALVWPFYQKIVLKNKLKWPSLALGIWLLVGLSGLVLIRQDIFDHYFNFLNPAPFILFGSITSLINSIDSKRLNQVSRGIFVLLVLMLMVLNLSRNPLLQPPNNQLKRTQEVARFVIDKSNNQSFNFALISANNYDTAYQFYLEQYGHKPKVLPIEKTDQLFVVCEDKICQPVGHPKYEIAAFGWTKISDQYQLDGLTIFKLISNNPSK